MIVYIGRQQTKGLFNARRRGANTEGKGFFLGVDNEEGQRGPDRRKHHEVSNAASCNFHCKDGWYSKVIAVYQWQESTVDDIMEIPELDADADEDITRQVAAPPQQNAVNLATKVGESHASKLNVYDGRH